MNLSRLLKKYRFLIGVFYKRDSQVLLSLVPRYLWAVFICIIYRFIFQAALSGKAVQIDHFSLPFPVFLISGIASVRLLLFSLKIFDETLADIRRALPVGELLMTPTSLWEITLAHVLWKGFLSLNELLAVLISSRILLHIPLTPFAHPVVIVSGILIVLSYAGMGMTVSALSFFIKKIDPVFLILNQISAVFCGVFFPITLFPKFLQIFVSFFPMTHALKVIRLSLAGAAFHNQIPAVMALLTMTALFLAIGTISLHKSLNWARKNGKL